MSRTAEPEHLRVARERQLAVLRAMTPQQRLQQAMRMNRMMRLLLAAGFRQRHPEWTDGEVNRAVAERILYGRTG